MLLTGALLLLLSPTLIFMLDQLNAPLPGDPLTLAVTLGVVGLLLAAISQRHKLSRLAAAVGGGVIGLALQFYLIALFVLETSLA